MKFAKALSCVLTCLAMLLPGASRAEDGKPQRVVSLNLCADELVLRLADRQNVSSVTWLARDAKSSTVADLAADVPVNHGLAEEIVGLDPDLVIAGRYTTRMTVAFLRRLDMPVLELAVPATLKDVRTQIRQVAEALGEAARGEEMIDAIDAALATERPRAGLTALVVRPNGFTTGEGSLADHIITRAGLINLGPSLGLDDSGQIPLERILTAGADVLIMDGDPHAPASLAEGLLNHPALKAVALDARVVAVPTRLWTCAGPQIIEAVERLADVTAKLQRGAAP